MEYSSTYLELALVLLLAVGLFAAAGRAALVLQAQPNRTPESGPAQWTTLRRNAVSWTRRDGA